MRYEHAGAQPVYAPNSFGGPAADIERYGQDPCWSVSGEMVRNAYTLHREDYDYRQAGELVRKVLSETDREHLVNNVVGHMKPVRRDVQDRALAHWRAVDGQLGDRIAAGLGIGVPTAARA